MNIPEEEPDETMRWLKSKEKEAVLFTAFRNKWGNTKIPANILYQRFCEYQTQERKRHIERYDRKQAIEIMCDLSTMFYMPKITITAENITEIDFHWTNQEAEETYKKAKEFVQHLDETFLKGILT